MGMQVGAPVHSLFRPFLAVLAVGLFLCAVPCVAQTGPALPGGAGPRPEVDVTLSTTSVRVGEPLDATVTLRLGADAEIAPFEWPERLGDFEVSEVRDVQVTPGGRTYRLRVATFQLDEAVFGPVELPYLDADGRQRSARSEPHTVKVRSVLTGAPNAPEATLRPPRPPFEWPVDWRRLAMLVALGLVVLGAVLALLFWLMRRFRRKTTPEIAPVAPLPSPDEEALAALAELEQSGRIDRDTAKAWYSALSEILRRYLGRRYRFEALEMTSSELIDKVSRLRWSAELFQCLVDGLEEGDSVKFAKHVPSVERRRAALEAVRKIVMGTRPAPSFVEGDTVEPAAREAS